jgi:hypothetical protein
MCREATMAGTLWEHRAGAHGCSIIRTSIGLPLRGQQVHSVSSHTQMCVARASRRGAYRISRLAALGDKMPKLERAQHPPLKACVLLVGVL